MKTDEVKYLLQRYFNGESTEAEERELEMYFQSGEVAEELAEYAGFFGGISELADSADDQNIEDDVMDYILENEHREKNRYRSMWKMVTGVAASVIIVLGGFLFYQEQQKPFDDTFENPDEAYVHAVQTLQYLSGKYNKGLAHLSDFEMLQKGTKPLKKGTAPVVEFYEGLKQMEGKNSVQSRSRLTEPDSL